MGIALREWVGHASNHPASAIDPAARGALDSAMTTPSLILLASPDEYLLELERADALAAWVVANPDGEVVSLDPAPAPARLVQEVVNRSLFAPARLVVVPAAAIYLSTKEAERASGEQLAGALRSLPLTDATLLLTAVSAQEPQGALAELVASRGSLRFLPVPAPPKPWEEVRVTLAQRAVLLRVIARVAPAVAGRDDTVTALCEAYGFHVRELAQAAERLALAGDISADAVRAQAGVGECSTQQLEKALRERDRGAVAHFLGVLSAGGVLVGWRGDAVDEGGVGPVLTGTLNRLLRTALAVRLHALRCGLEKELDPGKCAAEYWYPRVYKPSLHERLAAEIATTPDSPVAGASQWQLHRTFRLAACYSERELITALTALARCGAERTRARDAVPALTPLLLTLTEPRPAAKKNAPPPTRQRSSRESRA